MTLEHHVCLATADIRDTMWIAHLLRLCAQERGEEKPSISPEQIGKNIVKGEFGYLLAKVPNGSIFTRPPKIPPDTRYKAIGLLRFRMSRSVLCFDGMFVEEEYRATNVGLDLLEALARKAVAEV